MTTEIDRRSERGSTLLIAVLIVALMGVLGTAAMNTVTRDRQVAGYQGRSQTSFYAAEAGVAFAMGILRRDAQALATGGEGALLSFNPSVGSPPDFPTGTATALGGGDFPAPGSPTFVTDPDARDPNNTGNPAQAIRYIGRGEPCEGWVMSSDVGSVQWAEAIWDIRVRGSNPGGTVVNIQATGSSCHPYN